LSTGAPTDPPREIDDKEGNVASIELDGVSKVYGADSVGVRDVSLDIKDGEFVVFLGPSGCGKSTTLRLIAGLESLTSGEIRIGGKPVTNVPPRDRNVAVVFQSYALYPHMSVFQNMAFGIKMRGAPADVIDEKVHAAAGLLELDDLLKRKPAALSGGQRQRVALGRAIVRDPQAFLLDEPLSNLDAQLRAEMRLELVKLHRTLGRTMVYVTHDQVEAMTMGDRICIMRGGRLIQAGRPLDVYANPIDTFVARFLASPPMNLIPARLDTGSDGALIVIVGEQRLRVPAVHASAYRAFVGRDVLLGARSEDFYETAAQPDCESLRVSVVAVEALGAENIVIATMPGAAPKEVAARLSRHFRTTVGSPVELYLDMMPMHLFDPETGEVVARPTLTVAKA
jgi:sn-glycerol 3-phosphate transport system ATP-binding protein/multiple sugar transport system ATP-binding protein